MTRYAALLRGVNVGGITIRMAELAEVFRGLGYGSVRTVLASGNVVFESDAAAAALKSEIEEALRQRFGYEAWVHVLDTALLQEIIDADPQPQRDGWHRYVIFFMDGQVPTELVRAWTTAPDGSDAQAGDAGHDTPAQPEEASERVGTAPGRPTEEFVVAGRGVLYWTVERGKTLETPFGKAMGSARLRSNTTNRNLNTLEKLVR